jgi:hypothetical protein
MDGAAGLADPFSFVEFCVGAAVDGSLAMPEPWFVTGLLLWFSFVEFCVADGREPDPSLV